MQMFPLSDDLYALQYYIVQYFNLPVPIGWDLFLQICAIYVIKINFEMFTQIIVF